MPNLLFFLVFFVQLFSLSHQNDFPNPFSVTNQFLADDIDASHEIVHVENMQSFEKNINHILKSNKKNKVIVIHCIDNDHYLIPDDSQKPSSSPLQNSDFDTIPENWIEYYATDITPSIDQSGILVQTMTTINDDNARGEIAYSRGMLSKISMEYELSMPLYAGLFLLIGGVVGGSFTPEVDFSKSSSTYCTCPVIAGRTAQLRVFPIRVTLTPHSKKMKWNRKLQKLATKLNTFKKDKKFTLLFLTGLEDVECRYI